jgi:signal transduction histidine kinase/CheY-like chemotaxis protein
MSSNSTTVLYSLYFILFFDLILLVGLGFYYRKLGYRYLKFGAVAMAVEMFTQATFFVGALLATYRFPYTLGGIGKMVFAVLLLACVAHLVKRKVPMRLMLASTISYLGYIIYVFVTDKFGLVEWVISELPSVLLLLVGVSYLVKHRKTESPGISWLAGLLVVHVVLKLIQPFLLQDTTVFVLMFFYNIIVVMMMGAVLIMISSEWMIISLDNKNSRLEEYEIENRRLELQFAQAQKLESLGVLAGGIAHDFNNMLTSILGYTSLAIKKLPVESDVRKDLYMVMSGARQAVDLTSQMLVYAGKGAVQFESLDISDVVGNMSSLVGSIVPKKIRLIQNVAGDLPVMKGDKVQLGQVLMNLVANGVDAIEDKQGVIEISTGLSDVNEQRLRNSFFTDDLDKGAYLYLRVKDTGSGMDPLQVDKIFDPFYSKKQTRKGLGLSSLSGIVRQHKGFIEVKSSRGRGSEFTAYFPVILFQDEALGTSSGKGFGRGRIKGRILLAEDDKRIRSLIASILENDGFQIFSAEDGKEAIKLVSSHGEDFQLFLLDCTMPKISGTEVYRHIRTLGLSSPVILLSGYHQEQALSDISNDSGACFIKKPFDVDDFLEQINKAVNSRAKNVVRAHPGQG